MIFCLEKQVEKALGTKGFSWGEEVRGPGIKEGKWQAQCNDTAALSFQSQLESWSY